jgi:diaminohydroxyphosphoribosylaminopyrimidine deaminase/5-amino-6-(5-phosphoribosylamino)uracil reductase
MRDQRPHVTLKLAVSADEKVGRAGRRPAAITGPAGRDAVHLMRAQSDAIMIGIGTALSDDPQLTCRLPGMALRSPVRVVLDRHWRLPLGSTLVRTARRFPTWVFGGHDAPDDRGKALSAAGVVVRGTQVRDARLTLFVMMYRLAEEGITRLMVEGGPTIAAALIAADLVDEAVLLRARQSIGPDGIDALEGMPLTALTQSPHFKSRATETIGEDIAESFERASETCLPESSLTWARWLQQRRAPKDFTG